MRTPQIVAALAAITVARMSFATDTDVLPTPQSTSPATSVPNDLTNYQGDRITFNTDLIVRAQKADGSAGKLYCIPAHVKLRGGVGYSASLDGKPETGTLFRLLKDPAIQGNAPILNSLTGRPEIRPCTADEVTASDSDPVELDWTQLRTGVDLRVSKETLDRTPPNRYGLTYGLLAVPFKYQLTGPKEFTGSATVGPYFGYRTTSSSRGYGISYIGFLGYSNISVTQTVNGESKSQNLASIGYGLGAVATIKGNFQLGAVLGFDHVSKDSQYKYNNKPWLAVELGYSFLQ